ncbi:MAG: hypothetical protein ABI920_02550, partial [Casimicrobiaceae bacterium]
FPIIPCNLCGSQEHLQRKQVSAMLRDWERQFPGRIESVWNAMGSIVPTHLLDRRINDFAAVGAAGEIPPEGDLGFDVDPIIEAAVSSTTPGVTATGTTIAALAAIGVNVLRRPDAAA